MGQAVEQGRSRRPKASSPDRLEASFALAEVEADRPQRVLIPVGGNKSGAARLLGIGRKSLHDRTEGGRSAKGRWEELSPHGVVAATAGAASSTPDEG